MARRVLDGPRPVLQLRPLRQGGLPKGHGDHAGERRVPGQGHRGHRQVPDRRGGRGDAPAVAFNLAEEHAYDEFDIAFQLAAERGWMLPAYTMPPNAEDVKMMRALVKLNLNRSLVDRLDEDIAGAIETLEKKGPVSESERKLVKTSVTH